MALWRVQTAEGERLARGPVDGGPVELLEGTLDALLAAGTLDAPVDRPGARRVGRARAGRPGRRCGRRA